MAEPISNTTTTAAKAWAPDQVAMFSPDDMLTDALILQTGTHVGNVEGDEPRVIAPYVATDPEAGFVAEGTEIEIADLTMSEVTISTDKIGVITATSRELIYQPGAAERIALSLRRSVTQKADTAFMANATDPTGLLEIAGIDTAGTLEGNLFAAYDAVAAIEADGGQATHLLVNPIDWAKLSKVPTGEGSNQSLLANVTDPATRSLAGVPVIVHSAVTEGTALMLDKHEVLTAYGELQLARSDDVFFTSDSVGIRATWRIGWTVVRPTRLQKLTVA